MWTEENEKEWKSLTEYRELNIKEVGKLQTIDMLQKLVDSLKSGKEEPYKIDIECIRGEQIYGCEFPGPVIGRKITIIYK